MPQPVVSTIQRLVASSPETQTESRPASDATSVSLAPKGEPGATGELKESFSPARNTSIRAGQGKICSRPTTKPVELKDRSNPRLEVEIMGLSQFLFPLERTRRGRRRRFRPRPPDRSAIGPRAGQPSKPDPGRSARASHFARRNPLRCALRRLAGGFPSHI